MSNSSRIEYIKDDLFTNKDDILLHACNCKKTWGRGVATTFAKLFPHEDRMHQHFDARPGDYLVIDGPARKIICLFTSEGYGKETDSEDTILSNTEMALNGLSSHFKNKEGISIASPKINAGLFRVPWEKTESLIEKFLERHPTFTWKIYYQ